MSDDDTSVPAAPLLRIVRGEPSADELAAVVAVMASLGAGDDERPPKSRPQWASPARLLRSPLSAGPGAWRASALPR